MMTALRNKKWKQKKNKKIASPRIKRKDGSGEAAHEMRHAFYLFENW